MLRPALSTIALPLKCQSHPQLRVSEVPGLPQAAFNRAFVSRETSPLALPPAMLAIVKILRDASSSEDDGSLGQYNERLMTYDLRASEL